MRASVSNLYEDIPYVNKYKKENTRMSRVLSCTVPEINHDYTSDGQYGDFLSIGENHAHDSQLVFFGGEFNPSLQKYVDDK